MTAYSIQGYGVAVNLRSAKTILVEGPTDRKILSRLILEKQLDTDTRSACVIDEVGLASNDTRLAGKGSKEKIEMIVSMLPTHSSKLNFLVDREWEGIDIENVPAEHKALDFPWGVRTKGHSIENYWFQERVVAKYLKMFYGTELNVEFFFALETRFDDMIKLAAAYSFAVKRMSLITRCASAVRAQDVEWDGRRYVVIRTLNSQLATRNVTEDVVGKILLELDKQTLAAASGDILRWLCHGHLGEEMIWACVANLASTYGCSDHVVQSIERGAKAEKLAHHADCLATGPDEGIEPLGHLIAWID